MRDAYASKGMRIWTWDVDTSDYTGRTQAQVVNHVVTYSRAGDTVLMHMGWNAFNKSAIAAMKSGLAHQRLGVPQPRHDDADVSEDHRLLSRLQPGVGARQPVEHPEQQGLAQRRRAGVEQRVDTGHPRRQRQRAVRSCEAAAPRIPAKPASSRAAGSMPPSRAANPGSTRTGPAARADATASERSSTRFRRPRAPSLPRG